MRTFRKLAIASSQDLIFGSAPKPIVTKRGMNIGGGVVYPEINFTLPPMLIEQRTMPQVRQQYQEMINAVLQRAANLAVDGLVVEFETLPPMTQTPQWGVELTSVLNEAMEEAHAKTGLKSVLRITPNDIRELVRPPLMRSGPLWDAMLETFDSCASAGAELLSIESVGGKEVHDEALMNCDIAAVLFSLCVMGVRDMTFLWTHIKQIADRRSVICAGDTACGFGNTAMVLAEQKMIPRVFAAVVRAISAVRSLVAYECGAVGPGKDCGYENAILKAITGCPMAMEGKSAACAHFSPLGNISAATCDTWSNESVQNVKLLSGMAPVVSIEQLAYDCRLMNQALADGPDKARLLRDWLVRSDAKLDPQAFILSPHSTVEIARSIVEADSYYAAGKNAALTAIDLILEGLDTDKLNVPELERPWLEKIRSELVDLPDKEDQFIAQTLPILDRSKFLPREYDLEE